MPMALFQIFVRKRPVQNPHQSPLRLNLGIAFPDIMQFQHSRPFRRSPVPVRLRRINRCFFLAELQCFPSPMCIIAHFVFCACRLDGIWHELAVSLIAAWSAFDGAPDKIPFRQGMPAMNRKRTGLSSIQSESAAGLRMRFVLRPAFRTTIAVLTLAWRTPKTWLGERDSLQRACNGKAILLSI